MSFNAPIRLSCLLVVSMTMSHVFAKTSTGTDKPFFSKHVVFTAGESGYNCFRIPAIVMSPHGDILAFAEARKTNCRDDDDIDLVLKRSTDQGKTWEPMRLLADEGTATMNQPSPVVDQKTGEVLVVFCKNNQQVFLIRTKDNGLTWSKPQDITKGVKDSDWKYVGSGPGHGIQLKSGRLLIPSWGDTSPGEITWRPPNWGKVQFSFAMYSDDHGVTWKHSAPIESDASDECMAVEVEPNRIYMDMRSRHDKLRRAYSWSEDGGATWSKVRWNESLPEPSCQGSVICMARTKNSTASRILLVHPSSPIGRTHLRAYISNDQAGTWVQSRLIDAATSMYSDLAVAPGGDILCLYESGDMGNRLVLTRFNMSWLTEKADHASE